MKYAAIFMVILVLIAGALGIYAYAGVRLQIAGVTLKATAAGERVDEFVALQTAVDNGSLAGTAFAESVSGSSAEYSFFTYTFRIKNKGLIKAEMIEVQPVPVNGDVLSYATLDETAVNAGVDISGGSERDVWCVLLTSKQNQDNGVTGRSFRITYYIWGIPMTVTATYR